VSIDVVRHEPSEGDEAASPGPVFYFDLTSAECYLSAERVLHSLPVVAEWRPIALEGDGGAGLSHTEIERRVTGYGLQPLRWPPGASDPGRAARAATYAKQIGRAVAFSQAAFRQGFAGGRDIGDPDTLLIAGAACEMHPAALLKGMELRSVRDAVERTTSEARAAGVTRVPAIVAGGRAFEGDDGIEAAAAALSAA
jgi:2-hydroxychromene-2-carboxylate isomerase